MANRILFFVHYDKYNNVLGNIYYLLRSVRHMYSRVVFISNSPISDDDLIKLENHCETVIIRENKGFDFGAWKEGLLKEGWETLSQYDSVTLMNDSCFGPLFDLQEAYTKAKRGNVDFWGATLYLGTRRGMPGTDGPVLEHIQSYFLCFNKNVILSEVFQKFWMNLEIKDSVFETIKCYETQLTALLANSGFKYSAMYTPDQTVRNPDVSQFGPDMIIQNRIPLLKKKAFASFPFPAYIIDLIKERTDYPIDLIYEWASEMLNPNLSLRVCDKLLAAVPLGCKDTQGLSIAIHLHVFFVDILEEMIKYIENISINIDLYITTDTAEKRNEICVRCRSSKIGEYLKEIFVFENKGRDILPWLCISDVLGRYDIVGHFHTKKVITADDWIGVTWLHDFLGLLLLPADRIAREFAGNPRLGVVIPEIPSWIRAKPYLFGGQKKNAPKVDELWKRMGCRKEMNFESLDIFIASYGSMFWYRPSALRSLFNLNLSVDDFPEEPIGNDFTMAHCIEHVLVYCAWNDGFDYRIMVFSPPKISNFTDYASFAREDYGSLKKNSKEYRLIILLLNVARKTGALYLLKAILAVRRRLLEKRRKRR